MVKRFKHIVVDEDTYNLIMGDCLNEFLEHHPDFEGMKLTQNFILKKIVDYYLNN